MSGILPQSRIARVEFFENHEDGWSENAQALGTTAGAVTSLTTKTAAARAAYAAHQQAMDQSKNATQAFYEAERAMTEAGTDIIKQIKAKAAIDGNSIYTLAVLPAPAIPGPIPAPGTPSNFVATLTQGGALKLKWKCANPKNAQGTIYQISRSFNGTDDFVTLGVSGYKHYTDSSIPAGTASVTYRVIATRSTLHGDEAEFTVKFGVAGETKTAVVAPRIAA